MADFLSWTPDEIVNRLGEITPQQALDWDFARRHEDVADDQLFSYEQVQAAAKQSFPWPELPILREKLFKFKVYDGDMPQVPLGTIIAGGYLINLMNRQPRNEIDLDYFITADNPIEAATRWMQCCLADREFDNGYYKTGLCSMFTTHDGFSDRKEHQLILRKYQSMAAVLYGFDLGSSAVASDGKEIKFTLLGLIAHAWFVNLIDPRRRSPTFEKRLAKYLARGFALGMVGFNGFSSADTQIDLPHFAMVFKADSPKQAWGKIIPHMAAIGYSNKTYVARSTTQMLGRMWNPDRQIVAKLTPDEFIKALKEEIDFAPKLEGLINIPQNQYISHVMYWKEVLNLSAQQIEVLKKAQNNASRIRAIIDFSAPLAPYVQAARARFTEFDWKVPASHWWIEGNPQNQFTGSIEPRPETPAEFWGPYSGPDLQVWPAAPGRQYNKECPLCFEPFVSGESWVVLPCGHSVHYLTSESCHGITSWFQQSGRTCPMCRSSLTPPRPTVPQFKAPADLLDPPHGD